MISIILADDHKIFTDGLTAILGKETDLKIEGCATNGRQVMAMLRDRPTDVVVLDINMPEMDGIQTAKEIFQLTDKTEVVVLSMLATPEHIRQMFALGVKGYVLKDQGKEELVEAIRTVHAGRRFAGKGALEALIHEPLSQASPNPRLTTRELDVLALICTCGTAAEIAHLLNLKESTVQTHIKHMLAKLNLRNKQALLLYAVDQGFCQPKR